MTKMLRLASFAGTVALLCSFIAHVPAADRSLIDYEQPPLLTGAIYETSSGTNKVLFTYKRTAVRSNTAVHAICDFFYPNGSLAARETAVFNSGHFVSFLLEERQTGARGGTVLIDGTKPRLMFYWTEGGNAKRKTSDEAYQPNTLVGDMIPYFIVSHWNELARGQPVHFRFVASSRLETVGFKFVKEADVTWRGKPAVRLRMEPSSVIIRQLVDPLFFIVERDGAHRVLEYIGRITPKLRDGSKWTDLDARTVYDW
ncbi:MAG TPA: hypothetical protein VNT99_06510 [Methylomirabilota bacterium]|nr:hypothetical protein [Methylomirabilota bacterium]